MKPLISVIMSVYNTNSEWLKEAIESILNQTFSRFEFIIVLDKPTDSSSQIVYEYAEKDNRIVVIENDKNYGLTYNLYKAVTISKGRYIARMDADDISNSMRFEKQFSYMEENLDVVAVGSYYELIGDVNRVEATLIEDQDMMRIGMLFSNVGIAHPTAFIRKKVLDDNNINYDLTIKKAQDYKLWTDIMWLGRITVLPEILLNYRVHGGQISYSEIMKDELGLKDVSGEKSQKSFANAVSIAQVEKLVGSLNQKEKQVHLSLFDRGLEGIEYSELDDYLQKLICANQKSGTYHQRKLCEKVSDIWWRKSLTQLNETHSVQMIVRGIGKYYFYVLFFILVDKLKIRINELVKNR